MQAMQPRPKSACLGLLGFSFAPLIAYSATKEVNYGMSKGLRTVGCPLCGPYRAVHHSKYISISCALILPANIRRISVIASLSALRISALCRL